MASIDYTTNPSKRLKRASSFEIRPIFINNNDWKNTRNTSWAWGCEWARMCNKERILVFRFRTYHAHGLRLLYECDTHTPVDV